MPVLSSCLRRIALTGSLALALPVGAAAVTPREASRFLAQASFGPTTATIERVASIGPASWLNEQFAKPQTMHRWYVPQQAESGDGNNLALNAAFWQLAARADDQLRQRMAYALSQIFVVSVLDDKVWMLPRGLADYHDTLARHAFGNFRELLKAMALHPAMGLYMSHLRNRKEDAGHMPDENFARELLQLMSIGMEELNADGSRKLSNGRPIASYTQADITNLARVFTGWSWGGTDRSDARFWGDVKDKSYDLLPMQAYAAYHSTAAKTVLGQQVGGTAEQEMDQVVNILFMHPNTGPFIGRQLIQHLVSSNPSPAYIGRVSAAFANNGAGVRGDMRAVIRAILLDPEARSAVAGNNAGRLREPVLRLANWMRAFHATSASGRFRVPPLDDTLYGLGQTPLRAPSVFGFYRPDYAPPNSGIAAAGLSAPAFQLATQTAVLGYLNFLSSLIPNGIGSGDVRSYYSQEVALAGEPEKLAAHLDLLLLNGGMTAELRKHLLAAINAVPLPLPTVSNAAEIRLRRLHRVQLAILLAMSSPEYLVQK
ncbi:DUF1800 family protein [Massilia sp. YIM B04103]|uniref:DUF1800 domain-containing protein n=1 Tax=Massilia sp. YIM B04103 TaxID=2963106 RepID=UPI00210AC89C|nr:DUF1800 domain-containing protein [Massilia sp. YIM B04103]